MAILPLILPFFVITSEVISTINSESTNSLYPLEDFVNTIGKRTIYQYNQTNTDLSEEDLESFGFEDLYYKLDCVAHATNPQKPLLSRKIWAHMQKKFAELAEPGVTLIRPDKKKGAEFYSAFSDGKGRGAFAARNFKKGELVHDGNFNTAFWNDGWAWKRYVMALPKPLRCDVMEWTWTQEVGDNGWFLCLSLNDASFLNSGGEWASNIATTNETTLEFYALRGTSW